MQHVGNAEELLVLENLDASNCAILQENKTSTLTILWFEDDTTHLFIDNELYQFKKNQIVCLTEFHHLQIKTLGQVKMIRFNRAFYCILDNDTEVSCKGILFFGASNLPIISMTKQEEDKFTNLWNVFVNEMESEDDLQLEMLQMLLKRFLILCTRIYKEQHNYTTLDASNVDIIREFNFLVEKHFREKHTVACYAQLLNKSPKTISNLFAKLNTKTPLQFIQDRILLESKRQLKYTDKTIKEIAYHVGYEDIQSFSRFFKKNEGISPSDFKKNVQ